MSASIPIYRPEMMWRRYALALSLFLALVLSSHYFQARALKGSVRDAELVQVSGKQRALSQEIILYATMYAANRDEASRETLEARISEFHDAHDFLVNQSVEYPALDKVYNGGWDPLGPLMDRHIWLARQVMEDPDANAYALRDLQTHGPQEILSRLNDAVQEFQTIADRHADRLHLIGEIMLVLAFAVILFEVFVIFLPAQRLVQRTIRLLEAEVTQHEEANDRLSNFLDVAADLYWESDLDHKVTYVKGRFLERMKGGAEWIMGRYYHDLVTVREEDSKHMAFKLARLEPYLEIRVSFQDAEGNTFILELSGTPRIDQYGKVIGYAGTANDVTKVVTTLDEVTKLAHTDALTGIANKRAFENDLNAALAARKDGQKITLIAVDLDRFKEINDSLGHAAGDEVLKEVSLRIRSNLRGGDWVARLGGDEFCVVCHGAGAGSVSQVLAPRISRAIKEPIELASGETVSVGVSMGVAEAPGEGDSVRNALLMADTALYEAKNAGRNTIRLATERAA